MDGADFSVELLTLLSDEAVERDESAIILVTSQEVLR
jgi:hypothetical protein